jgi:salicylate hydroxylase
MTGERIAIAGAGIAGLTTALCLLQRGILVDVYEQASQLHEVGAGVQISPNGSRVLQSLGLEPELHHCVCLAEGKEIRLWRTGQRWSLFDLGQDCLERFGAPYWMIHRADLHRILLQAFERRSGQSIRLNARVEDAEPLEGRLCLTLSDGSTTRASALIAADGIHSAMRQKLLGETTARYTGLLAWRGLVPMDRVQSGLRTRVGSNWVGPGSHVVTYPVSGGLWMNIVGIVEKQGWHDESWTTQGTQSELLADFADWHPEVLAWMRQIETPYKWALLERAPQPGWAQGRICLIGDAAHPTLPFLAQGANMAIEDAAVMARCLQTHDDPAQAFRVFEASRWNRTADIVNRSADNARRFHNACLADATQANRYIAAEWAPDKVRHRYDDLFEYDALTTPLGADI